MAMTLPPRRILIADDHDLIRRGIRSVLEMRDGWSIVAEASDGRDAIDAARSTKPDIAILDLFLPSLNGIDLTRVIRRMLPATEILIYTMLDDESAVREALFAGARGYVLKSDAAETFVAAVEALARHKPFFTEAIAEALLDKYLASQDIAVPRTLTEREREVVQLIAEGKINKEIARILEISVKTVETHRAAAMNKIKIKTTADLVRYAIRNHIIQA